jgi:catechol 2,3-dioxygenase-like lactoylglutathione lyase family enzyme
MMKVKRIVSNIDTKGIEAANRFYRDVLGLEKVMDLGWISTYATHDQMRVEISFATQGGSNTPVPDLSIEVDDVDEALEMMRNNGFSIEYGPVDEPWGVRRFYVYDPFGKLINVLGHIASE